MNIYKELLAQLPTEPVPVTEVVVGLHWTMVTAGTSGLASTMAGEHFSHHPPALDVGRLQNYSAQTLAEWILSKNLLEASIGMATINALLQVDIGSALDLNAGEIILRHGTGKNVVIIGHFPFAEEVQQKAKNCWILEKRDFAGDLPPEAASDVIPRADVVAISGTALINHSIQNLLNLRSSNAYTIVLGPSTPLSPFWFTHGVQAISGTVVVDPDLARTSILQGANFKQVQGKRLLSFMKGNLN